MAKILLIHGYATWRDARFVFQSEKDDAGFRGFSKWVQNKEVDVFRWGVKKHFTFLEALSPLAHVQLYLQEKRLSEEKETLQKLETHLTHQQPSTIICHSLGAYLLSNYLQSHTLPDSVQTIIFIQADLPRSIKTVRNSLENLSNTKFISVINYYCPWDYTLILGAIMNGYLPAGLVGLKTKIAKNVFYPLYESLFVHTSSIRSQKFAQNIVQKYNKPLSI